MRTPDIHEGIARRKATQKARRITVATNGQEVTTASEPQTKPPRAEGARLDCNEHQWPAAEPDGPRTAIIWARGVQGMGIERWPTPNRLPLERLFLIDFAERRFVSCDAGEVKRQSSFDALPDGAAKWFGGARNGWQHRARRRTQLMDAAAALARYPQRTLWLDSEKAKAILQHDMSDRRLVESAYGSFTHFAYALRAACESVGQWRYIVESGSHNGTKDCYGIKWQGEQWPLVVRTIPMSRSELACWRSSLGL